MHKTIHTGIIGYGMAGKVFHAPFIGHLPGYHLAKISTSNPISAQEAKARYPQVTIVPDEKGILEDPAIDLVIIGTPNEAHLPLAKAALLNGKHVIVEKPFTVTAAEADALIALAQQQNRILTVHHNRRFVADYKTVKKVIASNLLGNLVSYEAHYDRFRSALRPKAWREADVPGAGILYDLGAHLIDQALELFGLPHEITADIRIQRPGGKVDDHFELILGYPTLKVTLQAGMLVKKPGPHFQLHGDCGSFLKYGADVQEEALKAGAIPLALPDWGVEPESQWGQLVTDYQGLNLNAIVESERGSFEDFFLNVQAAIWGEAALLVKPEAARDAIRVIELAMQSHREKRTIVLGNERAFGH